MEFLDNSIQSGAKQLMDLGYMSSEVTDSEEESKKRQTGQKGPKARKIRKLQWESPLARKIKKKMDKVYRKQVAKPDHLHKMAKVTRYQEVYSDRAVPESCPDWVQTAVAQSQSSPRIDPVETVDLH